MDPNWKVLYWNWLIAIIWIIKFIEWLENHNTFCNSLVDRIVPGKPNAAETKKLEASLGYEDELLTMSEVFRLWAIEGNEKVKDVLSFAKRMKELSLRLISLCSKN